MGLQFLVGGERKLESRGRELVGVSSGDNPEGCGRLETRDAQGASLGGYRML